MAEDFEGVEALSFDCYGTLIDWETGLDTALREWSDAPGLLESFGRHETRVQTEHPGLVYPAVLMETLRRVGAEVGVEVSDEAAAAFGASVGRWPAFADSREALRRLAQRFPLVVLSNVDRGSFALSNARLGVDFAAVVTAQDVGSYKPADANFERLLEVAAGLGVERAGLLHVAQSLHHDHVPARRHGLRSVWIDRRGGTAGGATPAVDDGVAGEVEARFPSMDAFAAAILG